MKVLFDVTDITEQRKFMSISQYKLRLLKVFSSQEKENITLLVTNNNVGYIKKICPQYPQKIVDNRKNILTRIPYIRCFVYPCLFKKVVESSGCDVFFSASDTTRITKLKMNVPKVIVIHDLKAIKYLDVRKRKEAYDVIKQNIDTANRVIAISNYTKEDILRNFECPEHKIDVVYNSVNVIAESVCPKIKLPHRYILWVNTFDPYKNIFTLIKGYSKIFNEIEQDLVLVGCESPYWIDTCLPFIKEYGFENRVHVLFGISDEELRYLYENADLFVTTSTHEGFGYTPIEAAIYKCPVISTRCEALSDTTQGKFTYLDSPFDDDKLSTLMLEIIKKGKDMVLLMKISEFFKNMYDVHKQKDQILKVLSEVKNSVIKSR